MPSHRMPLSPARTSTPRPRDALGLSLFALLACNQDTVPATQDQDNPSGQATKSTPDSGSTSPETSPQPSPDDPTKQACEAMPGLTRCVWTVPPGWRGPILPQTAQDPKTFGNCTAPLQADEKNQFISKFQASPGTCKGCEVELDLGECSDASLVRKKVDPDAPSKCSDFADKEEGTKVNDTCQGVSGEKARAGEFAIGIRPGQPTKNKAECKVTQEATLDPSSFETLEFHRLCQGQLLEQAACANQRSCVVFDVASSEGQDAPLLEKVCVFKAGEHACPKLNYTDRTLIYRGVDDQRSCEPCQIEHEQGELSCDHLFGLSSRDPGQQCQDPETIEADDLCLTEEDFLGRLAPWGLVETERKVRYSGQCSAKAPKAVGEVKFKNTWTLCCRNTWE